MMTTTEKIARHAARRRARYIRTACRLVANEDRRRGCALAMVNHAEFEVYPTDLAVYVDRAIAEGTPAIRIPHTAARAYMAE